jgi:hypothetical protein
MRKIFYVFLILAFCVTLFQFKDANAARNRIIAFLEKKGVTKAYISAVTNSTGDRNVNEKNVKKSIEEALRVRRSHTFEIAKSEASADITVEVDIVEYFWTEKDPVEAVFPPAAAAIDGARDENYARLAANIVVKDAENGKKLWGDKIRSAITDDTMSKKASYGLISKELAKDFVARLCRKPRKR